MVTAPKEHPVYSIATMEVLAPMEISAPPIEISAPPMEVSAPEEPSVYRKLSERGFSSGGASWL